VSVLRLFTHPEGVPKISSATPMCSRPLLERLRHKASEDADSALLDLVIEASQYLTGDGPQWTGDGVMGTFELSTRLGPVRLFTVVATLGAPLDVTAADLAIETFLPADSGSADRLRALAG
jgi:hypothetical protein